MTCKGCNTNFCYNCGVEIPHPPGSTCVHACADVDDRNNNQVNVYIPIPNNQGRNPPGRERIIPINMHDQPIHEEYRQEGQEGQNREQDRYRGNWEHIYPQHVPNRHRARITAPNWLSKLGKACCRIVGEYISL